MISASLKGSAAWSKAARGEERAKNKGEAAGTGASGDAAKAAPGEGAPTGRGVSGGTKDMVISDAKEEGGTDTTDVGACGYPPRGGGAAPTKAGACGYPPWGGGAVQALLPKAKEGTAARMSPGKVKVHHCLTVEAEEEKPSPNDAGGG